MVVELRNNNRLRDALSRIFLLSFITFVTHMLTSLMIAGSHITPYHCTRVSPRWHSPCKQKKDLLASIYRHSTATVYVFLNKSSQTSCRRGLKWPCKKNPLGFWLVLKNNQFPSKVVDRRSVDSRCIVGYLSVRCRLLFGRECVIYF